MPDQHGVGNLEAAENFVIFARLGQLLHMTRGASRFQSLGLTRRFVGKIHRKACCPRMVRYCQQGLASAGGIAFRIFQAWPELRTLLVKQLSNTGGELPDWSSALERERERDRERERERREGWTEKEGRSETQGRSLLLRISNTYVEPQPGPLTMAINVSLKGVFC